jgi:hypothetical protein
VMPAEAAIGFRHLPDCVYKVQNGNGPSAGGKRWSRIPGVYQWGLIRGVNVGEVPSFPVPPASGSHVGDKRSHAE